MRNLEIDIETYSSVSLQKCGVYKYAESPDFEILLFGFSVDGSPVILKQLEAQFAAMMSFEKDLLQVMNNE